MAASVGRVCGLVRRWATRWLDPRWNAGVKAGGRSRHGTSRPGHALLHGTGACSDGLMVDPEEVRRRIAAAFPGARVTVADTTGGGDHFDAHVVAAAFAGLGLVDQHRLVYAALGDLMPRIHALSLRTETDGEITR